MTPVLSPKSHLITRRAEHLTAIHRPETELVLWSRRLPAALKIEVMAQPLNALCGVDFITLRTDPAGRIEQQFELTRLSSPLLVKETAFLAELLGRLSGADRIRVRFTSDPEASLAENSGAVRLLCSYFGGRLRQSLRRLSGGLVALVRPGAPPLKGIFHPAPGPSLLLEALPPRS